jgi:feruloyl esterase
MTVTAKAVIEAHYGRGPRYSYMSGYSQSGERALMSAQRYPADYDGILAGAPPLSWALEMTMRAWTIKALSETPASALDPTQAGKLHEAVTRCCAGPDGLIADGRDCNFDPGTLRCPAADGGFCLRDEQITAVRKVYRGPHTSSGRSLYRGLAVGSEFSWPNLYNVGALGVDRSGGSWLGVWRFMIAEDPTWTLDRLDFDRDPLAAERKLAPHLTFDNPDLEPFARRGGRMILYQPWADEFVPPETLTDSHAAVVKRLGRARTDQVLRLFMIPGVDHGARGPGAGLVTHSERFPAVPLEPGRDMLATLQRWVEEGVAPDRFVASKVDEGRISRTRLLCPEPKIARYRGSGDVQEPGNWDCVER